MYRSARKGQQTDQEQKRDNDEKSAQSRIEFEDKGNSRKGDGPHEQRLEKQEEGMTEPKKGSVVVGFVEKENELQQNASKQYARGITSDAASADWGKEGFWRQHARENIKSRMVGKDECGKNCNRIGTNEAQPAEVLGAITSLFRQHCACTML